LNFESRNLNDVWDRLQQQRKWKSEFLKEFEGSQNIQKQLKLQFLFDEFNSKIRGRIFQL